MDIFLKRYSCENDYKNRIDLIGAYVFKNDGSVESYAIILNGVRDYLDNKRVDTWNHMGIYRVTEDEWNEFMEGKYYHNVETVNCEDEEVRKKIAVFNDLVSREELIEWLKSHDEVPMR